MQKIETMMRQWLLSIQDCHEDEVEEARDTVETGGETC